MVKRWILGATGLLWVAAMTAGTSALFVDDNTPGVVAHAAPASWPADTNLQRVPDAGASEP